MTASSTERSADRARTGGDGRGQDARKPTDIPTGGWKDIAKRSLSRFQGEHAQLLSAGVAFWFFLSLFPALIAAISIFGLALDPANVAQRVEELFGALPADAQGLLEGQLDTIASGSGGALGIGVVVSIAVALWSASAAMSNLMEAINIGYRETDDRGFVKKKAIALGLTLAAIVFAGLALVGIGALPAILESAGLPPALGLLAWPLLGLVFVVGLAGVYRYAPDRDDAELRWISAGAVIAVVLWAVASVAFQLYVANFGSYSATYGALAAVVILMLWLLLTAMAVVLGAFVNAELEHQTAHDTTTGPDRPMGEREAYAADHVSDGSDGDDDGDRRVDLGDHENQRTEEHVR